MFFTCGRVARITTRFAQSSKLALRSSLVGATRCIFSIPRENLVERLRSEDILFRQNVLRSKQTNGLHQSTDYQPSPFSLRESPLLVGNLSVQRIQESVVSESSGKAERMRENAAYLLNLPEGSMEHRTWNKAEETFHWWISQRTEESVDVSIDLLERFVKETLVDSSAASHMESLLDGAAVTTLVFNWYYLWKGKELSWTPFRFLKALDCFHQGLPHVRGLDITGPAVSYIINGLKVRSNPSKTADAADELLLYCLANPGKSGLLDRSGLSRYIIHIVLDLWGKSGRSDAVDRAEITFSRLRELDSRILDIVAYNTMLDVYSQSGEAKKAEALLLTLTMEWLQDWRLARPNQISVMKTAAAWTRSTDPHAAERVTLLLRRLRSPLDPLGKLEIAPDTDLMNKLLDAWARSRRDDAAKRAYELLHVMKDRSFDAEKPDIVSYAIVADAFAKAGDHRSTERVVDELCAHYEQEKDEKLSPRTQIFSDLMNAWMRSNETHKEQKLRDILNRVRKLHTNGVLNLAPETFLYNQVLSAIVYTNQEDKAKRADDFLQEMKLAHDSREMDGSPDEWSYCTVINAYLQTPDGIERAHALSCEACSEGVALGLKTVGLLIQALTEAGDVNRADIWMHRILDALEQGVLIVDENSFHSLLRCVLNGWLQISKGSKEAGFRALKLIRRTREVKEKGRLRFLEEVETLVLLQDIWLRSGHEEAPDRAYEVIEYMLKKANGDPDMAPDESMYARVIAEYKKAGNDKNAEMVLFQMQKQKERDP